MDLITSIIVIIVIFVIILGIIYFLSNSKKTYRPNIHIEEGKFKWINQSMWHLPPVVPLSHDTLLGSPMFKDERYDPSIDTLNQLYLSKLITDKQVWIIRGKVNKNIKYWSFTLYKMNDNRDRTLEPVGYSINNEMIRDARDGDDIVLIVSPNYKLAQFIANQIHQKDYGKKLSDDRHVVFSYMRMPNYDPSAKYTLLYEATKNAAGALPKFTAERHTYTLSHEGNKDNYPFIPVEKHKDIKNIIDGTINEYNLFNGDTSVFDITMDKRVKTYKSKTINTFSTQHNMDYLYTDSGIIDVSEGDTLVIGVVDHSANGKCLYSELIFVDGTSGHVNESRLISMYDSAVVGTDAKIKIHTYIVPFGVTKIKVLERIVIDMSIRIAPNSDTIVPARVYNHGSS